MGQYAEGQRLKGSDGNMYVVRNGVPVRDMAAPLVANPKLPGELTGQNLNNQRTAQEIAQAQATAAAVTAKTKADAAKAELDLKNAQEAYTAAHPKGTGATEFGPDFLKTLSPPDREIVQALGEGRLAFPAGFALKAPWWQQKLEQVAQAYPDFDATNFNNRAKARASLINGKLGASSNALNTSMGHLDLLQSQISGTASHGFTPLNAAENYIYQKFGDPGITNFKDTAGKLASELTSVYRNGGGAEADVVRQLESVDPNASYAQKEGIIRNALDLLASKQAANLYQYNLSSGGKPQVDLLDPAARAVLDKFPDIRDKYFAQPSAPMSHQAAALLMANGAQPPSGPSGGTTPSGFAPPPTGPNDGGLTASGNGYNTVPNEAVASFWNNEIGQHVPYRQALSDFSTQFPKEQLLTAPDPNAYAKASTYAARHPNIPYAPTQSLERTPLSPAASVMNNVAQSPAATFGVDYYNSLGGGLPLLAMGDQGARYQMVAGAENPKSALLGNVLGTVGGALGTSKLVGRAAPYLGKFGNIIAGNPARQALTGDTLFFSGEGAAQNPDHPVAGAAIGATSAIGGNMLGRYVLGPGMAAAVDSPLGQGIRGMFGRGPTPQPLDPGQNLLFNRANGNPLSGIQGNLQDAANLNLPYSLADADPRLRALAGSAVRKSPDVLALANQNLVPRQLGQAERAVAQIDTNLAPVGDVPTMQANLLKQAQAQSKPLYQNAKSQPVPELTANPALKEILDRPAAQAAVRKGYETALNNGEDVGTLTYATDPSGQTVQYGNPSWNVLHYARQALDASGDTSVRQALDKQILKLNPGFKAADAKYAGIIKGSDALQAGADATGLKVTPEATQRALAGFPNHLPQFQQGYASTLADQAERARMVGDPYNAIYGSPNQQAKINLLFPNAPQFARARALESDMSRTYTEALGGSQTQPRTEADKLFDNPTTDAALDLGGMALAGVPPVNLAKRGIKMALTNGGLGLRGAKAKADAVGPLLLNTDPNANLATLNNIIQQGAARRAYIQQMQALGGQAGAGMFGAPILYGLSQQ